MELHKLIKGKAIGAQDHFAETFNFIVDWICNIKGDEQGLTKTIYRGGEGGEQTVTLGIMVDTSVPGHPVIRLTGDISATLDSGISAITDAAAAGDTSRVAATTVAENLLASADTGEYVLSVSGGIFKLKHVGVLGAVPSASIAWLDPT